MANRLLSADPKHRQRRSYTHRSPPYMSDYHSPAFPSSLRQSNQHLHRQYEHHPVYKVTTGTLKTAGFITNLLLKTSRLAIRAASETVKFSFDHPKAAIATVGAFCIGASALSSCDLENLHKPQNTQQPSLKTAFNTQFNIVDPAKELNFNRDFEKYKALYESKSGHPEYADAILAASREFNISPEALVVFSDLEGRLGENTRQGNADYGMFQLLDSAFKQMRNNGDLDTVLSKLKQKGIQDLPARDNNHGLRTHPWTSTYLAAAYYKDSLDRLPEKVQPYADQAGDTISAYMAYLHGSSGAGRIFRLAAENSDTKLKDDGILKIQYNNTNKAYLDGSAMDGIKHHSKVIEQSIQRVKYALDKTQTMTIATGYGPNHG